MSAGAAGPQQCPGRISPEPVRTSGDQPRGRSLAVADRDHRYRGTQAGPSGSATASIDPGLPVAPQRLPGSQSGRASQRPSRGVGRRQRVTGSTTGLSLAPARERHRSAHPSGTTMDPSLRWWRAWPNPPPDGRRRRASATCGASPCAELIAEPRGGRLPRSRDRSRGRGRQARRRRPIDQRPPGPTRRRARPSDDGSARPAAANLRPRHSRIDDRPGAAERSGSSPARSPRRCGPWHARRGPTRGHRDRPALDQTAPRSPYGRVARDRRIVHDHHGSTTADVSAEDLLARRPRGRAKRPAVARSPRPDHARIRAAARIDSGTTIVTTPPRRGQVEAAASRNSPAAST